MFFVKRVCAVVFVLSVFCLTVDAIEFGKSGPAPGAARTALDAYVHAPDDSYRYELAKTIEAKGYTAYVLDMVSQTWRIPSEVDRTEWRHWLIVVVPNEVKHDTGFLYISGGSNNDDLPSRVNPLISSIAVTTASVVAELRMVPNQPLVFAGETRGRSEDASIAYTWDKFLRTGDETWPLRLPMTKSAVRAMDTITDFCRSKAGGNIDVNTFVVAGGSKRGWTTWTTGAVDTRVVAIIPIVIDMLNMEKSFEHHYRVYGYYAPAVGDYKREGVMEWLGRPEYRQLLKIVEPYEYRSRMTIPKFMVNSTGDQFFVPDSAQFYFDDLPGEKYLRYVANADHGMGGSDALQSVMAYYHAILNKVPRPRFSWRHEADGSIRVFTLDTPTQVLLWQAHNPKARNFRKDTIGEAYSSTVLTDDYSGVYLGTVEEPDEGFTAYFVELTYPSGGPTPFKFTTQVYVTPDVYPSKRYKVDKSNLPSVADWAK